MVEISIVIPAKNEELNIRKLLDRIFIASYAFKIEFKYEAIIIDDGYDYTTILANHQKTKGQNIRTIQGQHKGLGQAILDGIQDARCPIVVVLDADLSHRPEDIPKLIQPIVEHGIDLVIGSRYCRGGDSSGWTKLGRFKSILGTFPQYMITGVKDSNSGFFAFRKEILNGVELRADSWKIMLEILFKAKWLSKIEVPITFVKRKDGESKNNVKERVRHAIHLLRLLFGYRMRRFWKFCMANGVGTGITFLVSWICTSLLGIQYLISLLIATACAVCANFIINAKWTFASKGKKANSPDYERHSYYKGLIFQRYWKHRIAKEIRILAGECGRLLDIGCGSSPLGLLTNHSHYVGLDGNSGKIEYMKSKNLNNCEYIVGSVINPPFNYNVFDTVIMAEVIEHLDTFENAHKALIEVVKVLKKGGQLIISTPNFGSWAGRTQDKLYGIFQPNAYADEHNVKFDEMKLFNYCVDVGLTFEKMIRPLDCELIARFRKD